MRLFQQSSEQRSKVQVQLDNERQPQAQAEPCESCSCIPHEQSADLRIGKSHNKLTFHVELMDAWARA